ncbi:hypothetical protein FFF34_013350 [Inquilinus sp. KBS0705]|nr:hypothetical protein FFF34_013350 [Inquilinus sp. KBS0705]
MLFEALLLLFLPFAEQKETSSPVSSVNYRHNQEKRNISAAFYIKNRSGSFQSHKSRFQSVVKETCTVLNSGFSFLKSDYHQRNLSVEWLTKLMLFPYHSFW